MFIIVQSLSMIWYYRCERMFTELSYFSLLGNSGVISSEEDEYDSDGSDKNIRHAKTFGRLPKEVRSIIMLLRSIFNSLDAGPKPFIC